MAHQGDDKTFSGNRMGGDGVGPTSSGSSGGGCSEEDANLGLCEDDSRDEPSSDLKTKEDEVRRSTPLFWLHSLACMPTSPAPPLPPHLPQFVVGCWESLLSLGWGDFAMEPNELRALSKRTAEE